MMVFVLTFVWGGFFFFIITAIKKEKNKNLQKSPEM